MRCPASPGNCSRPLLHLPRCAQGPEDDGGSPVVGYQVQLRPRTMAARQGGADEWLVVYQARWWRGLQAVRHDSLAWAAGSPPAARTLMHPPNEHSPAQGPELACTVSSLRAGCSYMARVAALSKAGTGAHGPAAVVQTSPSVPGAPLRAGRGLCPLLHRSCNAS